MNNNFDENQNIEVSEETEEFSTVFSDPTAHNETSENKKGNGKKRITMIIAGVLAVAVLIGSTVAVVKLIPEKTDDDTTSSNEIPQISVLQLEVKDVKKVTVLNENGTFVINNTASKDEDGEDVYTWSLQGYDEDVISEYSVSSIAESVIEISALREITSKSAEDCGLAVPKVTATVTKSDDSELSVLVGDKSPDNTGIYLKLSDSDKVYLISDELDTSLNFTALDLATTAALSAVELGDGYEEYISNDAIATFDEMTVSGKNFDKKVVIKPNEDEKFADLQPFVLTSPVSRVAQNAENVLPLFSSSVPVAGAYALDAKAETVKSFGLDTPDVEVTIKIKDVKYTYKFTKQSDGYYAVWPTGCKMIAMVSDSANPVLTYNTISFYSTWVHLQSIDDLSGFKVKSEGKEYDFSIKVDDSEDADEKYVIKYGDKKLTAENFQSFYQYCISLTVSEFVVDNVTASPEYEITYIDSDTGSSTKISFYRISATKYQFSVNGEMIGKINASDINRIADYVKKVAKDEAITIL